MVSVVFTKWGLVICSRVSACPFGVGRVDEVVCRDEKVDCILEYHVAVISHHLWKVVFCFGWLVVETRVKIERCGLKGEAPCFEV